MAIVNDYVCLPVSVMGDIKSLGAMAIDFVTAERHPQIPMSEQPESKERVRNPFRKEHPTHTRRYVGKGISDTSDNDILEDSGLL